MPTIPKLKRKRRTYFTKEKNKLYSNRKYQELRTLKLKETPWCELCYKEYKEGKRNLADIQLAQEVHHVKQLTDKGITKEEQLSRLLDYNNLMSLCTYHHHIIHGDKNIKQNK